MNCPVCAIDMPSIKEMYIHAELPLMGKNGKPASLRKDFVPEVLAERARLALLDPQGEHDQLAVQPRHFAWTTGEWEPERIGWQAGAVVPLDGVRARAILLHLAEPGPRPHRVHVDQHGLDERAILERLGADLSRDHGMVRCPAHEDRAASLSWRWDGERALLHDFGGCSFDEIRAAL